MHGLTIYIASAWATKCCSGFEYVEKPMDNVENIDKHQDKVHKKDINLWSFHLICLPLPIECAGLIIQLNEKEYECGQH